MKYKQVICNYCSKKFKRSIKHINWAIKKDWKTYCSKRCKDLDNITSQVMHCGTCNKEIIKTQVEIKRSKSGKLFCSRHCSSVFTNKTYKTGVNNANYKNGSGSYRNLAFRLKNWKCEVCQYSDKRVLQVHHKDGNRRNNSIENLEIVCPTHHCEKHFLKESIK